MTLQLGVLAMYLPGNRLEEIDYFRKLSTVGRKLGIEILVFTPDDVEPGNSRIQALVYHAERKQWVRKRAPFPPLIYDRCRYHGVENYRKLTAFRRTFTRLKYLSRPLANKWTIHEILSEQEEIAPHLPATIRYRDARELSSFIKKHSVVYMKPKSGTGGRGIIRLQRTEGTGTVMMQGRDPNRRILPVQRIQIPAIPGRLSGWKLQEKYIVQQGIPLELADGRVHDFRMLVQKDGDGKWQVTGCAGRIGPRRSVTSNLHGGGSAIAMNALLRRRFQSEERVTEIKDSAYALGLRVVEHLEKKFGSFCEAGIDLAVDPKGHVWILEVNPKPSREVFSRIGEKETYRRAIARPLEYALSTLRRHKSSTADG